MRWLVAVVLIIACEKTETPLPAPPDPLHGIELPEVAGPGYVAAKGDPSILVTTRGFVIDGTAIMGLTNGDVAPDEKEGGSVGMKIPRLSTMGGKLAAKHVASPLVIALDRHLTYRLLMETLFSLKQKESGWVDFALLAKHGASVVSVPISLPDPHHVATVDLGARLQTGMSGGRGPSVSWEPHHPATIEAVPINGTARAGRAITATGYETDAHVDDVKAVISLTRDNLVLWSITGLEGTLGQPKATISRTDPSAMTKLSAALSEIVHRRWPRTRTDASFTIIVMADGTTTIQTVAEVFGAVRASPDGGVLFPDLLLSSGFE